VKTAQSPRVTDDEIKALQRELAAAKAEIIQLRLSLDNVTLLLKTEMTETGKLADPKNSAPGRFDAVLSAS
jgi:hypothetical protein